MIDIRKLIENASVFKKKQGRALTVKKFVAYIKHIVILDIVAVLFTFTLNAQQAFISLFVLLLCTVFLGIYSILSLRLRKIEERFETGRIV